MREADRVRGDARGGCPDPDDLADGLVDGEQRPHFLLDAGRVLAAQDRLPVTHVRLVVTDDGLASPPPRVAARQIQRRVLRGVQQAGDQQNASEVCSPPPSSGAVCTVYSRTRTVSGGPSFLRGGLGSAGEGASARTFHGLRGEV